MLFRQAKISDLPAIMRIIEAAVSRMLSEGKCQWNENYPRDEHILADIGNGVGHVLEERGEVIAYGAVVFTGEPAYDCLEGDWLTNGRYVVVHRMAVDMQSQSRGVGRRFLNSVEHVAAQQGIGSFRIDTNFDNDRMLALLARCGFEFTGLVRYPTGERRAFEKLI